jgi:hypothetical protein
MAAGLTTHIECVYAVDGIQNGDYYTKQLRLYVFLQIRNGGRHLRHAIDQILREVGGEKGS